MAGSMVVLGRTYQNPVFARYFADPFVFLHEGAYYAVGTGQPEGAFDRPGVAFQMLRSEDLCDWSPVGAALECPENVPANAYWAPEVAYSNGTFYMYYSMGVDDKHHQLRVATSANPEGPYIDNGVPVLDPGTCPFAIDAHPFQDDDGAWYLFYARDFLDSEDGARPGTAVVAAPLIEMVHVPSTYSVVQRPHHDWQRYQEDRSMYWGQYDWHTLEGPCVRKRNGLYYCIYSGGNWQNESYGLDYFVADHPLGPYRDDNPGFARLLRTVPGNVIGPGHNSIVVGPDGKTDYVVYHAWDVEMTARKMSIDPITWTPDGPRCDGPSWQPRELV